VNRSDAIAAGSARDRATRFVRSTPGTINTVLPASSPIAVGANTVTAIRPSAGGIASRIAIPWEPAFASRARVRH
jgi:hypothetical protein